MKSGPMYFPIGLENLLPIRGAQFSLQSLQMGNGPSIGVRAADPPQMKQVGLIGLNGIMVAPCLVVTHKRPFMGLECRNR